MRGFFNGLVLGIVLGAVGFWFVQKKAAEHPEAQQRYAEAAAQFHTNATAAIKNTSEALRAKLDTLDLNADQIKGELAKTGEVIRHKAHDIGEAAVNAASDAPRRDRNQSRVCRGLDAFGLENFRLVQSRSCDAFRHRLIARRHRQGRRPRARRGRCARRDFHFAGETKPIKS